MNSDTHNFTIEDLIGLVEKWLITGELEVDMLADNFKFVSPFWESNSKADFINKFKDPAVYRETSLTKIIKFDPLIRLKGLDEIHFAIILRYQTKNGGRVDEAVLGRIDDGLLSERKRSANHRFHSALIFR